MLDVCLDHVVGELPYEVGLPVVLESRRDEPVESTIQRGIGHWPDMFGDHGRDLPQRLDRDLSLLYRSGPACDDRAERVPVTILRDERQRWGDLERGKATE